MVKWSSVRADNFLVLGDWGGLPTVPYTTLVEESTAKQMARTAEEKESKYVIALGDNFYFSGVRDEFDDRFDETYRHVFNETALQVPWFVIAGNHDHYGNITGQVEYSKHSKFWNFPNLYYTVPMSFSNTGRKVKLVMIDTVVLCGNSGPDDENSQPTGPFSEIHADAQWNWLEKELRESNDIDYLLVGGHFPVWSVAEHGPTHCLVDRLKPMLEKYNVSAYINGHDHNLQHIKEDKSSVHYFTIGCANFVNTSQEHLHKIPKNSLKFFWAEIKRNGGFASVDVDDDALTITFVDSLGAVLHQQEINPRTLTV